MVDVSIQHEDMGEHKYMEDISEKHVDLDDQLQDKNKAIASHHRTKSQDDNSRVDLREELLLNEHPSYEDDEPVQANSPRNGK